MKVDRYVKFVLTVIAACLVWVVLSRPSQPTALAQGGRYAIAAGTGGAAQGAYLLDTISGQIKFCYLNGKRFACEP